MDMTSLGTFVPGFPVRPGVFSGSAVKCTDGRILYVYVDDSPSYGGSIRGAYFETVQDLVGSIDYTTFDTWRQGRPIPGSDHLIIAGIRSAATVWWDGGALRLSALYVHVFHPPPGDWAELRTELWTSPSGNGEDWVKTTDIAAPLPYSAASFLFNNSALHRISSGENGVIVATGWRPEQADSSGYTIPTAYTGAGAGWTKTHEVPYGFGGNYGGETSRAVVSHAGALWWNSAGNVSPNDQGTTGAGASWTDYDELPLTKTADRPYLTAIGGRIYAIGNPGPNPIAKAIRATTNPQAGGWTWVTPALHLGDISTGGNWGDRIGQVGGFRWTELSPGVGVLFNHDKVWLAMGGWVLGAMGRS